jgi:hypothetical protein
MSREVHVRNCEGVGVKLPRATRLCYPSLSLFAPIFCQPVLFQCPEMACPCRLSLSPGAPLPGGAGLKFLKLHRSEVSGF